MTEREKLSAAIREVVKAEIALMQARRKFKVAFKNRVKEEVSEKQTRLCRIFLGEET